jgi:hypothetical protein
MISKIRPEETTLKFKYGFINSTDLNICSLAGQIKSSRYLGIKLTKLAINKGTGIFTDIDPEPKYPNNPYLKTRYPPPIARKEEAYNKDNFRPFLQ